MPKDTPTTASTKPVASTLRQILDDMAAGNTDPVDIGELPPAFVAEEISRTQRSLPIPDLARFAKLWMLIGEGNTGKTKVARYLVEKLIEADRLAQTMVAALAAGNRNLVNFAPGALQPPSADPKATATWAAEYLMALQQARWGGVWDFGGGDASLQMLIDAQPNLADKCEQESLAIVAAYTLSPRLDDLVFLKTYERRGFRPRAIALILNLATADSPAAFNALRRQPEYKASLDRGAVELWLPAMPQNVALAIERAMVFFSQARDGTAPEGRKPADISLLDRVAVRDWLMRVETEFREIEAAGWLPWT